MSKKNLIPPPSDSAAPPPDEAAAIAAPDLFDAYQGVAVRGTDPVPYADAYAADAVKRGDVDSVLAYLTGEDFGKFLQKTPAALAPWFTEFAARVADVLGA